MDLKQNPFSLYDFLGYFTPGAIFLYGLMAAYAHTQPDTTIVGYIAEKLSFKQPEVYIPFILAAYTIGHFLSFISSITVERYSIWAFGYPSKYLLGLRHGGYYAMEEKRRIRKFMRTLVAVLLAPIVAMDWLLGAKAGLRDLYAKKLDAFLIAALKQKLKKLVVEHADIKKPSDYGNATEHDFFRYAYHYAVENAPNHLTKMQRKPKGARLGLFLLNDEIEPGPFDCGQTRRSPSVVFAVSHNYYVPPRVREKFSLI